MADTRTTTRGPVPIALGSAAGETEEGRGFFQDRLALFGGWIFLISGSFYIVYRITTLLVPAQLDVTQTPVGDPNSYHLYATLVAGALWAVARSRKRLSTQVVGWLDATSSLLMCALFAVMAVGFGQTHLAVAQDPMHGLLTGVLACAYVLLSRAVAWLRRLDTSSGTASTSPSLVRRVSHRRGVSSRRRRTSCAKSEGNVT